MKLVLVGALKGSSRHDRRQQIFASLHSAAKRDLVLG